MFFWDGGHMGGWGFGLMSISMVLFWALVIFGIVLLVRWATASGRGRSAATPPTPEQLLAERFARGEIDAEEYQSRLDTLRAAPHGNGRRLVRPEPTDTRSRKVRGEG